MSRGTVETTNRLSARRRGTKTMFLTTLKDRLPHNLSVELLSASAEMLSINRWKKCLIVAGEYHPGRGEVRIFIEEQQSKFSMNLLQESRTARRILFGIFAGRCSQNSHIFYGLAEEATCRFCLKEQSAEQSSVNARGLPVCDSNT